MLLGLFHLLFIGARRVAFEQLRVDFEKGLAVGEVFEDFLRPVLVAADVEACRESLNAVEAPRAAVVNGVCGDEIRYYARLEFFIL